MEEALRRAYLAAMDIPVWLPRAAVEAAVEPPPAAARETRAPAPPPQRAPRPTVPAPAAPTRSAGRLQPSARPDRAPAAAAGGVVLGFATAGRTLFIEDLAEARPARAAGELLASLAFVISGERTPPTLQEFAWPPPGVPFLAGEARDAVRGRIDRVAAEGLGHVVLLGPAPARLLLGGDEAALTARPSGPWRLEGLDCPVLCLPSLTRMLREPAAKREAWQALRLSAPGG